MDATQPAEIRKATTTDTDDILRLWTAAGASVTATDTHVHVSLVIGHAAATVLVAVRDGRIVGTVIGTFDGWRGHLYRLVVHPEVRRQGLARAMVREVEAVFRAQNVTRVLAFVERDRPAAIAFWEAAGYSRDDNVHRYVRLLAPVTPSAH
jgi:ribosomal protein S18 acetylase RimI-like enzyme